MTTMFTILRHLFTAPAPTAAELQRLQRHCGLGGRGL
jgi:hypothetical protein